MPTDPQYALVYTAYGCEYVKVGTSFSPDVTVGQKVLKIYDINPETGELTEHGRPRQVECGTNCCKGSKVTVEQVREKLQSLLSGGCRYDTVELLDFIDNGPKKPTAREVFDEAFDQEYARRGYETRIHMAKKIGLLALREAGYLKDEA